MNEEFVNRLERQTEAIEKGEKGEGEGREHRMFRESVDERVVDVAVAQLSAEPAHYFMF